MAMIPRPPKPGSLPTTVGPVDQTLHQLAPALEEFLTLAAWDDGKARATGTVMLLAEGGLWKAWVHDRDGKRSLWLSADSLVELVEEVESTVAGARADWRADKR